jgi:hypothetical protein
VPECRWWFELEGAGDMLGGMEDVEDAGEVEDGGGSGSKGGFADEGPSGWVRYG